MFDVFFEKANELYQRGEPFAMAVVVRREAPVSGRLGDKAIIQPDGSVFGWIGGGCTLPVIVDEAVQAIRQRQPRLVRITPRSGEETRLGVTEYQMECHGGGAVDIFIEPIMPKPQLLILGNSIVAKTLVRLARVLDYRVVVVSPRADRKEFPEADEVLSGLPGTPLSRAFCIVSTQGERDAEMLRLALEAEPRYLAFVASRKKTAGILETLRREGIEEVRLASIQAPAGLDIGARTSEEIAVSILAEIIQRLREAEGSAGASRAGDESSSSPEASEPEHTLLEIAGMTCQHCVVNVKKALAVLEGIQVVEVEIGRAKVILDDAVELSTVADALLEAGYELV